MVFHKQDWGDYTRYVIIRNFGTVFLDTFTERQDDFGGTAFIWGLFVSKKHRRKGIAKALIDEAEYTAKLDGHKSVVLEWKSKTTPREMLDYYLKSGYEIIGHYRDEEYTLEKQLNDKK